MFAFNCSVCRREGQGRALVDAVTLETLKVPDRDAEKELVDAVNDASPECAPRPTRYAACRIARASAPDAACRTTATSRLGRCVASRRSRRLMRPPPALMHCRLLRDVVRCFRSKLEQPDPHVQLLALQARCAGRGLPRALPDARTRTAPGFGRLLQGLRQRVP